MKDNHVLTSYPKWLHMHWCCRLLLWMVLFHTASAMLAQTSYKVTATKLNVRSAPSTNARLVGSLQQGATVTVYSISSGWAEISYNGTRSYANASYLQQISRNNNSSTQRSTLQRANNTSSGSRTVTPKNNATTPYSYSPRKALWTFVIGGMPRSVDGESFFDWDAQLGGEFPLTLGQQPFIIETGLRYSNKQAFLPENGYLGKTSALEVPLRLTYDMPIADKLSLRMGAGPYLSYNFQEGAGLQLGIEPAAALQYKNLSLGLKYSLPVIKGFDNDINPSLMVTLGIRFKSKDWKYVGTSLAIAGAVASVIADALPSDGGSNDYSASATTDDDDADLEENDAKLSKEEKEKRRQRREELHQTQYRNISSAPQFYRSRKSTILDVKRNGYGYHGMSFNEKVKIIRENQKKMKEVREEYERKGGKPLSCADKQLEEWNPTESEIMEKCSGCDGDGKCHSCQRPGNGKCSSCDGSGNCSRTRQFLSCPNCQYPGNGKCKNCDGTGKCQICKGKKLF